jgi:hypothetical protein
VRVTSVRFSRRDRLHAASETCARFPNTLSLLPRFPEAAVYFCRVAQIAESREIVRPSVEARDGFHVRLWSLEPTSNQTRKTAHIRARCLSNSPELSERKHAWRKYGCVLLSLRSPVGQLDGADGQSSLRDGRDGPLGERVKVCVCDVERSDSHVKDPLGASRRAS